MELTKDMVLRVRQTGAGQVTQELAGIDAEQKRVAQSADQATDAAKRHGQATSQLTQFVKAQRTENRQQNFLFRESKDVVGSLAFGMIALSSATGKSTVATQGLERSLLTGFTTFQAADFAMAALGVSTGGVSTAIKAVLAGGAGIFTFLSQLDTNAKKTAGSGLKELEGRIAGLSALTQGKNIAALTELAGTQGAIVVSLERQRTLEIASANGNNAKLRAMLMFDQLHGKELSDAKIALENTLKELEAYKNVNGELVISDGLLAQENLKLDQLTKQRDNEAKTLEEIADLTRQIELSQGNIARIQEGLTPLTQSQKSAIQDGAFYLSQIAQKRQQETDELYKQLGLARRKREEDGYFAKQRTALNRPSLGTVGRNVERLRELDALIQMEESEDKRNELLKKRNRLQEELNRQMMTTSELTQHDLSTFASGLRGIGSALEYVGLQSSALWDVVSALEAIATAIKAIDLISTLFGFLGLGGVGAGAEVTGAGMGFPTGRIGTIAGAGASASPSLSRRPVGSDGASLGGSINIYAMDAKSFSQFLRTPANRRVFVDQMNAAVAKGK